MIIKHVVDNIFLVDGIISGDMCEKIRKIIDKDAVHREKYESFYNVQCVYMKNFEIMDDVVRKSVDKVFHDIAVEMFMRYKIRSSKCAAISLRKIHGKTKLHRDGVVDIVQVVDGKVNVEDVRQLSVIVALNDDYEGGELYFPVQDLQIRLRTGQGVVFPPYWTHPHETAELRNNTHRYTLNSWLCGGQT